MGEIPGFRVYGVGEENVFVACDFLDREYDQEERRKSRSSSLLQSWLVWTQFCMLLFKILA